MQHLYSMTTRPRPWLACLLAGGLALGAASATAQSGQSGQSASSPTSARTTMSFQQVIDRVTALGYSDVREVERESDKLYEIKAHNSQGQVVELYVDARSGEVLREEIKRKKRHDR